MIGVDNRLGAAEQLQNQGAIVLDRGPESTRNDPSVLPSVEDAKPSGGVDFADDAYRPKGIEIKVLHPNGSSAQTGAPRSGGRSTSSKTGSSPGPRGTACGLEAAKDGCRGRLFGSPGRVPTRHQGSRSIYSASAIEGARRRESSPAWSFRCLGIGGAVGSRMPCGRSYHPRVVNVTPQWALRARERPRHGGDGAPLLRSRK